jgi:hypothetical protein
LLPPYQQLPQPLLSLLTSHSTPVSRHFFDHIRQYNLMFAMNSMRAKVIDSTNDGHGEEEHILMRLTLTTVLKQNE